ncbi:hypothetical protein FRB90_007968 [Tulasnella sp. 427]|nr:hypothetical protein FRB90_007968 [Tulasnella sp. 427]
MFKASPTPFVPPIPPDVTSSSESSPMPQQGMLPEQHPGLGRPGLAHPPISGLPGSPQMGYMGMPAYGYPAGFGGYAEVDEFADPSMAMGMMQRYQPPRRPSAQQPSQLRSPAGAPAGLPGQMAPRGYPAPFGYAPAGPQALPYGFSPYPQPSPYPYAAGGGFPYGGNPAAAAAMFGAGAAPAGYVTPYMTPMPQQALLDPVAPPAPTAMGRPGGGGGMGGGSVIGRPGQQEVDMCVGKWFPGTDYAPALDHLVFNIVKPPVMEIHPLLRPIADTRDSSDPFLVFDVLFPPNTIHVSNEPPRKSWSKGRKDPATFPRLKLIRLVTRYTSWVIQVSTDSPAGITVADVINAIHDHYRVNASEEDDWGRTDPGTQSEILMAYKWNRSTEMGAPGGIMPEALLRGDFLMERTMFAGIKPADKDLCLEKMDVADFPATFELLLHTR